MAGGPVEATPLFPMERDSEHPLDPPPGLLSMQVSCPVSRVRLWDGAEAWLVVRHGDQRALHRDDRLSANPLHEGFPHVSPANKARRQASPNVLTTMDRPEHDVQRRMLTSFFSVKSVERMRPMVVRIVGELLDSMASRNGEVDLVENFALPLPSRLICEILGVPYEHHEYFQDRTMAVLDYRGTAQSGLEAHNDMLRFCEAEIQRVLNETGNRRDLLTALAAHVKSGELTEEDAVGLVVQLVVAGHETTANMIALGTLTFLMHPEIKDEFIANSDKPEYVASAVEELLRYLSVTHAGRRRLALEDISIGETQIKAGEGVILANDAANRDPDVFEDPNRIDLGRNPRSHLAFGFGIHQCLGQQLARMELQIAYPALFQRFPAIRLAAEPAEIDYRSNMNVYGVKSLMVTW